MCTVRNFTTLSPLFASVTACLTIMTFSFTSWGTTWSIQKITWQHTHGQVRGGHKICHKRCISIFCLEETYCQHLLPRCSGNFWRRHDYCDTTCWSLFQIRGTNPCESLRLPLVRLCQYDVVQCVATVDTLPHTAVVCNHAFRLISFLLCVIYLGFGYSLRKGCCNVLNKLFQTQV